MNRDYLLTAELFNYSFENYRNHLGIGHARFEELMPRFCKTLERANREGWSDSEVAQELEIDEADVSDWLEALGRAQLVVDATTPAESFRASVRFAIANALEEGLSTDEEIEALTTQICYRASDLSVLLDLKDEPLSKYSEELRAEDRGGA